MHLDNCLGGGGGGGGEGCNEVVNSFKTYILINLKRCEIKIFKYFSLKACRLGACHNRESLI